MTLNSKYLAFAVLAVTWPALGAQVIKQEVQATVQGKKQVSTHTWTVDQGKFRLVVGSGDGEAIFLFNGKNFYACSKARPETISSFEKLGQANPEAIKILKNGACQAVPANFMVRFFLSPLAAAESVDATDGLKLTLALSDYQRSDPKPTSSPDCQQIARNYKISKSFDIGTKSIVDVKESLCLLPDLPWRDQLWQEVAKATIRQPRGAELMRGLKADQTNHKGFALHGKVTQTVNTEKGEKLTLVYDVSLKEHKTNAVSDRTFQIPEGYTVISPEQLTKTLVVTDKKEDAVRSDSKKGSIVEAIKSTFFCAIAATTTKILCASIGEAEE